MSVANWPSRGCCEIVGGDEVGDLAAGVASVAGTDTTTTTAAAAAAAIFPSAVIRK